MTQRHEAAARELLLLKMAAAKVVGDWHAHNKISPRKVIKWASLSDLEKLLAGESR